MDVNLEPIGFQADVVCNPYFGKYKPKTFQQLVPQFANVLKKCSARFRIGESDEVNSKPDLDWLDFEEGFYSLFLLFRSRYFCFRF